MTPPACRVAHPAGERILPLPDRRPLGLLLLLTLGITLPFVTQAFHIDDPTFIAIARQIARDPWRPYSFSTTWLGREQPAFEVLANPPLVPAYIALVSALFGEREVTLHLAFIPLALLAAWGAWRCAKCFVRHPGTATALYLVTPAFVVPSHTLMPDIALMAFMTHAVASFVSGFRDRRSDHVALGATFVGLACLIKYNGLVLIPLFLVAWWLYRKGNGFRLAWGAIPLAIVGGWSLHNILVYGSPHLLAATTLQASPLPLSWRLAKVFATASYLGAAGIFPLALPVIAWPHPTLRRALFLGVGIGAPVAAIARGLFLLTLPVTIALGLLLVVFGLYLATIAAQPPPLSGRRPWRGIGEEAKPPLLLSWWLGSVLVFNQSFLFVAVRYLLPAIFPAILLLVRALEGHPLGGRLERPLRLTGILTLLLSLGLSVGDMQFANANRDFARAFVTSNDLPSATRWFIGRLGFEYYMEQAGARALGAEDTSPRTGDLLIISQNSFPHRFQPSVIQRLTPLKVVEVPTRWPLRTISQRVPAFFHANFVTSPRYQVFLPYAISGEPLDRIVIYRVRS